MNIRPIKNVGIISTRIAGTDGVSLEIEKWVEVLKRNSFKCFYFAGEIDRDEEISFKIDEAHFEHPDVYDINKCLFGVTNRTRKISKDIHAELGEIVSGKKKGRTSDAEITLFDSTGLAIQDVSTAFVVYQALMKKRKKLKHIRMF